MDRITIKSLSYHAKHGHNEQERIDGNQFEVDITAYGSFRQVAEPDDGLENTFDYAKAERIARAVMEGPSRKMIETLCSEIGNQLFDEFDIAKSISVTVRKLSPPIETDAAYAEITLEWNR